ncbi:hypothetical protein [uncultured Marinobacter sp.]|uniref:hypothetical protein n=1 Tax=uncultured Marinobacter sp. TaxID=187379 RepID=UPI002591905E|nr:hypothetical protein [uncultured Marinobacter sp.]
MMVTENEDVLHRIANGMVCKFRKLVLKTGTKLKKIKMYDYWVHAVRMDDVEYIEVEWQHCVHFVGKFQLKPKVGIFSIKYPISKFRIKSPFQTNIELQYLPVIVNHAFGKWFIQSSRNDFSHGPVGRGWLKQMHGNMCSFNFYT